MINPMSIITKMISRFIPAPCNRFVNCGTSCGK